MLVDSDVIVVWFDKYMSWRVFVVICVVVLICCCYFDVLWLDV